MKNIYVLFGLVLMLTACHRKGNNEIITYTKGNGPFMYVKEERYDAGKVKQGDKVKHTFIVENRGKAELVIKSVTASCGCTIAKFEKQPIAPGKSTPIDVIFNSEGKSGIQDKNITVVSNAVPDTKTLTLHCEVLNNNK